MKKSGRPRTTKQPFWMLERVTRVVFAYQRARSTGEKHTVAIQAAIDYVRDTMPKVRISETGVKRILAKWCPEAGLNALSVSVPTSDNRLITLPNGLIFRVRFTAHLGPRTNYARANAVEPLARPE